MRGSWVFCCCVVNRRRGGWETRRRDHCRHRVMTTGPADFEMDSLRIQPTAFLPALVIIPPHLPPRPPALLTHAEPECHDLDARLGRHLDTTPPQHAAPVRNDRGTDRGTTRDDEEQVGVPGLENTVSVTFVSFEHVKYSPDSVLRSSACTCKVMLLNIAKGA